MWVVSETNGSCWVPWISWRLRRQIRKTWKLFILAYGHVLTQILIPSFGQVATMSLVATKRRPPLAFCFMFLALCQPHVLAHPTSHFPPSDPAANAIKMRWLFSTAEGAFDGTIAASVCQSTGTWFMKVKSTVASSCFATCERLNHQSLLTWCTAGSF